MRKRLISPSPQAGTLHDEGWLDLDREAVWTGGPQKQCGYSHAGVCCMRVRSALSGAALLLFLNLVLFMKFA